MPTITGSPAANADSGTSSVGTFATADIQVGWFSSVFYNGFVRLALAVPQGSTITSATLSLTDSSLLGTGVGMASAVKADAADDSTQLSSTSDFTGRTRTSASVAWSYTGANSGSMTTPDLSTVVQEIVNRSGWASGNHLQLFIEDTASGTNNIQSWQSYQGGTAPVLSVTYTAATPHALSGSTAVSLTATATLVPTHSLVGSAGLSLGASAILTVPALHPLSGTAAVVIGSSGVLTVPVLVLSTAEGSRARTGVVAVHITNLATASTSRERSGSAYPVTVDASGLVSGVSFRRWTFVDPVTLSTYAFEVNPNAATPASAKRPVDSTPTTARDGVPITFQGERDVPVGEFSGSLLSKEQHEAFVAWWQKQREILLIDDLGNEHYVVLAKYSTEQVKQRSVNKYRQKYTMQYVLMSEPT